MPNLWEAFLFLAFVGVVCWGVSRLDGIPNVVKTILYVAVGLVLIWWLAGHVHIPNPSAPH